MRVYTVLEHVNDADGSIVIGTFKTEESARNALVEHIVKTASENDMFRVWLLDDQNHDDLVETVGSGLHRSGSDLSELEAALDGLKKYLKEWIEASDGYYIFCESEDVSWHFDIIENELEED